MDTFIYNETEEARQLFDDVRMGLDAEDFIKNNPVGQMLVSRASNMLVDVRSHLEEVKPEDLSELQMHAMAARLTISWLYEAIKMGKDAEHLLIQQEGVEQHG